MQIDTDLSGLLGITLAISALLARVPRVRAFPLLQRAALLGTGVVVLSIPLWGLSLSGFVRGITGDLSIATLLLLALSLLRSLSGHALAEEANRRSMLWAVVIAAAVFYPLALGFGAFDPYRLGYGNLWFMAGLLGVAAWASFRYSTVLALSIALAVAAWSFGWYESTNLWDYLLDPWLAIYALIAQLKHIWLGRGKVNV